VAFFVFIRRLFCWRWRSFAKNFSGGVVNGITGLAPIGTVLINDPADNGVVTTEMSFLIKFSFRGVLILTLEQKLIVRSHYDSAAKPSSVVDGVFNFAGDFPVGSRGGGGGLMVGLIELVAGASAIRVNRDAYPNRVFGIVRRSLSERGTDVRERDQKKTDRHESKVGQLWQLPICFRFGANRDIGWPESWGPGVRK
jgi:hypothetical protein